MSSIEWTDKTWNPIAGCDRISAGCDNCYAIGTARRCEAFGHSKYVGTTTHNGSRLDWSGQVTFDPAALKIPLSFKKPTIWFVNSMSDIGHHKVTDAQVEAIFEVMNETPHHHYQLLTKRPHRIVKLAHKLNWTPNIWFGVSAEDIKHGAPRVRELRNIPAAIRFISAEPLLEDISSLDLTDIDWVIAGGESGRSQNSIRPLNPQWARNLRDACRTRHIPFFFKQWGNWDENGTWNRSKKTAGHLLDGQELFEMPDVVAKAMTMSAPTVPAATVITQSTTQHPDRHDYSDMILSQLQNGPMTLLDLRQANGANDNEAVNIHSWALVELQEEHKITKRLDGRYGLVIKVTS